PPSKIQLSGPYGARNTYLVTNHVCMNRELGLFSIDHDRLYSQSAPLPAVNLRASEPDLDVYYQIDSYRLDTFVELQRHYERNGYPSQIVLLRNTTLFVASPIYSYHYSHFLVNTAIGLTEMHARIYGNASVELADSPITP